MGYDRKQNQLSEPSWKDYVRKTWADNRRKFIFLVMYAPIGAVIEVRCANSPGIDRYRHIVECNSKIPGWTRYYSSGHAEPEKWRGSMWVAGEYDYWRPLGESVWLSLKSNHSIGCV